MSESAAAMLTYDGERAYCSVAAPALRHLDDMEAISWYNDAVQAFLDAQFAGVPFAMVLISRHENRAHTGRVTAEELTDRAGMPGLLGSLVRDNYDRIAKVVGVASSRGRSPGDVHNVYDLEPDAAGPFAPFLGSVKPRPAELS